MNSNFIIQFEEFEGPLDVLLELFKKNKLEIVEANIEVIVEQYLQIVEKIDDKKYDEAIEYLEFAAELILYKSKKILAIDEVLEEDEPEFDDLVSRILEYKRYQEASKEIKKLEEDRNYFLNKEESDLKGFQKEELIGISIDDFKKVTQNIFQKIEQKKKQTSNIEKRKELNVQEYLEKFKDQKVINFEDEIKSFNKIELITFFLAILEMLKSPNRNYHMNGKNIIINMI